MKTILNDDYELPSATEHGNVLVWVMSEEDGEEVEHPTGIVILDGPGWARVLDLYDPEYHGVPDVLPTGLYVFDMTVVFEADRFGEAENVQGHVHRYVRVSAPSRQRLLESSFEDFVGVLA